MKYIELNSVYKTVLSIVITLLVLLLGVFLFLFLFHFLENDINLYVNDVINGTNGIFWSFVDSSVSMKLFLYLELVIAPFIFIFIRNKIKDKFNIALTYSLLNWYLPLLILLFITLAILYNINYIYIITMLLTVLMIGWIKLLIIFIRNSSKMFYFTLFGIPLYILLQLFTPVLVTSEINNLEVELLLNNEKILEKNQIQNSLVGFSVNDKNSNLVVKLPVVENFDEIYYDDHVNNLKLILPKLEGDSKYAYFFLEKKNFTSICYQYEKKFWAECRDIIKQKLDFRIDKSEDKEEFFKENKFNNEKNSSYLNFELIQTKFNDIKYNDDKYLIPNRILNNETMFHKSFKKVYQMHHFQNFESPLYDNSDKLPASQYGPLGLTLVKYIGDLAKSFSNNDTFIYTVSGVQLSNILLYILILILILILKNDYVIKTTTSIAIFTGLILLMETTDTFAPGLSLFRITPQLILVIFAMSQLSNKHNNFYSSIPMISIYLSPLLLFYNEQFGLFTIASSLLAILVSFEDRRKKVIALFLIILSFGVYILLKEYLIDVGPTNSRILYYLTGIGIPKLTNYSLIITISLFIITPLLIITNINNNYKLNSIFIIVLSLLMFVKFVWNPSMNHLASIFPFILFPYIVLYYENHHYNFSALITYFNKNIIYKNENLQNSSTTIKRYLFIFLFNFYKVINLLKNYSLLPLIKWINMRKVLFILVFTISFILTTIYARSYLGTNLYKKRYIESIKTDKYSSFPRDIYVDSSLKKIFNDYKTIIKGNSKKIYLLTEHDNMISVFGKIHTNSPYSDFTTNVRTHKDINYILNTIQNNEKEYCILSDRADTFYYLPHSNIDQQAQMFNVYKSVEPIKNLARVLNTNLKLVGKSKYFELHCKL